MGATSAHIADDLSHDEAVNPLNTAAVVERYLGWLQDSKSSQTVREARQRLSYFVRAFPRLPITTQVLYGFIDGLTGAANTRRGIAGRVKALYTWLWKRGMLDDYVQYNLFDRIDLPSKPKDAVPTPLTQAQAQHLLQSAPSSLHFDVCYTLLRTGVRRGELQSMKAENLEPPVTEGGPGRIWITGKTGSYSILVPPEAYRYLTARAPESGYIFPGRYAGEPVAVNWISALVHQAFAMAELDMGNGHNGPQILRHTFASWSKQHTDNTAASAALAHHSLNMHVSTYGRISDGYLGEQLMKMTKAVELPDKPWWFSAQGTLPLGVEDMELEGVEA